MALTEQDLSRISDVVSGQIREQFKQGCLCGLKPQALNEMGHFWGMMADVGSGDASKSVETLRTVLRTQRRIEMASSKAALVALSIVVSAACYGAWSGIKSFWTSIVAKAGP